MRPSEAVTQHRDALLEVARRYGVTNVRVFGSVARGDDRNDSDVDLLVDAPRGMTYFDLARLKHEVESLTGMSFDIHTYSGLKTEVRNLALRDAKPL